MKNQTSKKLPLVLAAAAILAFCLIDRGAEAAYWPTPKFPPASKMMSSADSSTSGSQTSGTLTLP